MSSHAEYDYVSAPSGALFSPLDLEIIWMMADCGYLRIVKNTSRKKSGQRSYIYTGDVDMLTDPHGLAERIGRVIAGMINNLTRARLYTTPIIIGKPRSGKLLAIAARNASKSIFRDRQPIAYRICRNGKIREPAGENEQCFTIYETVTACDSYLEFLSQVSDNEYDVRSMNHIVFINLGNGQIEGLIEQGYRIDYVYHLEDIIHILIRIMDGDQFR